jgi:hypothetical protein
VCRFEDIELKPANTLVQANLVGDEYLVEMEAEAELQPAPTTGSTNQLLRTLIVAAAAVAASQILIRAFGPTCR